MGLELSHGEGFHCSYSAYGRLRAELCALAGLGDYSEILAGEAYFDCEDDEALLPMLDNNDCDCEIAHSGLEPLADRIEGLMGGLEEGYLRDLAERFVAAVRDARDCGDSLELY